MSPTLKLCASVAALALAACVAMPTGPAVMVLPGTGKTFDEFRFDDGTCRQFAYEQIGGHTAAQAQQDAAVSSAVVGTVIGAAAGAALGGDAAGAAAGAGVGLLGGSLYGASAAGYSAYDSQYRYDIAYQQCMYAKGHRVPVTGRFSESPPARPRASNPPPPPPPNAPPPPPG